MEITVTNKNGVEVCMDRLTFKTHGGRLTCLNSRMSSTDFQDITQEQVDALFEFLLAYKKKTKKGYKIQHANSCFMVEYNSREYYFDSRTYAKGPNKFQFLDYDEDAGWVAGPVEAYYNNF
jgi:hypothetical protein